MTNAAKKATTKKGKPKSAPTKTAKPVAVAPAPDATAEETEKAVPKFELPSYEGFPLLGWAIRWDIRGLKMPFADFCNLLEAHGIDKSIARETLAKNAAIRATKAASKGKGRFHRKVEEAEKKSSFVIAGTAGIDHAVGEAAGITETKVVFNKETKSLVIEGANSDSIQADFEQAKTYYDAKQIRTVILRYVKRECGALTVGELGSLYFIPSTNKPEMWNLQSLLEGLGKHADLIVLPIIDTPTARQNMWKTMTSEIQDDIKKQTAELESRDEVTEKMLETRLKRYQDLKMKVELYETVLSGTADELKSSIKGLSSALSKKLVED